MKSDSRQSAFALVIALSLMAFVLVLLLTITSLVQVETRSADNSKLQLEAEQAALLSLNIAIGELQKYAGHDQRVTAPADVLFQDMGSASGPSAGLSRARWAGVWNTADYDPSAPQVKEFQQWLVSTENSATPTVDTSDEGEVENNATIDDVLIFQGVDDASSVRVPKVQIDGDSALPTSYAYWVEDEGVKANLAWDEGEYTNDERLQVGRLVASPGADFGVFEGPFTGMSYPIEFGGANAWLENVDTVIATTGLPSLTATAVDSLSWLREYRHDMTIGTFGLMVDVKDGGLRRDLSLAFEMDGEANFEWNGSAFVEPPSKFNSLYGEFVYEKPDAPTNNNAPHLVPQKGRQSVEGLTAKYVYGDSLENVTPTPFSGDIQNSDSAIRGPAWWAMRDYANIYKRLITSGAGGYEIESRYTFPNVQGATGVEITSNAAYNPLPISGAAEISGAWDSVYSVGGRGQRYFLEMPYEVNYAPVLLGYVSTLSVMSSGDNLALGIDPIFYLWNPYNSRLTADRFVVASRAGLPGQIRVWLDGNARRARDVQDYIAKSANMGNNINTGQWTSYSITNVDLAPGEIKVYSPPRSASAATSGSKHPYNTDALEGVDLSTGSGALITQFPNVNGNGWSQVKLSDFTEVSVGFALAGASAGNYLTTNMTLTTKSNSLLRSNTHHGPRLSGIHPSYAYSTDAALIDAFVPAMSMGSLAESDAAGPYLSLTIAGAKQFCGVFGLLTAPANFSGLNPNPVEGFAQFNPLATATFGIEGRRVGSWNQEVVAVNQSFADYSEALEAAGVILPSVGSTVNGFWGSSYSGDGTGISGSTAAPAIDIPSKPILSLAQFAHANLSPRADVPMNAVGNSFASVFVDPVSPYGILAEYQDVGNGAIITASDASWLLNDALFDAYYLSGIAADYSFGGGRYSAIGEIKDTLEIFFEVRGTDYREAQVNPVLSPYLPQRVTAAEAVAELDPETDKESYKKLGAFSLINGAFNVNSTSVAAWAALLRANRGLEVEFADGGSDSDPDGTPFPRSPLPVESAQSDNYWSGLARLSDDDIWDDGGSPNDFSDDSGLAFEIVNQVKLRGPFMSLSDFVNHRVGLPKNDDTHYLGALQAAIEASGINDSVDSGAGGTTVTYASSSLADFFEDPISGSRPTTTGIYTDITQADLLMPLAPRLSARSDTFRIRGYGEVRSLDGSAVLSKSVCEAVLQRLPEYVDTVTDPSNNEAWDAGDTTINAINQQFGRRFKVVQFRWLNQSEI